MNNWEPVIGLEIHAQMKTKTKIFSDDLSSFGCSENELTSPVSLGMPGTLPVLNKQAVNLSIKSGLALNCKISRESVFSRKNYFYPDLPKGYQITQFDKPICIGGFVEFFHGKGRVRIDLERAHMEEDAGKSTHLGDCTLIDLNRAGTPLLEIVTKPVISSPEEAAAYARAVRDILRYVDTCDGNLEEGSLRCDCNVSVRKKGDKKLGVKVEIKNVNSFRFIEKAIHFEINRQIDSIESGKKIIQETRLYDSIKNKTVSMREKENAHDYRYFPDPDILPLRISEEWVSEIKQQIPELPFAKSKRLLKDYELGLSEVEIISQSRFMAAYFEEVAKESGNAKLSANWILGDLLCCLNEEKIDILNSPLKAKELAGLIQLIDTGVISGKIAKLVFSEMFKTQKSAKRIIEEKGLKQISDDSSVEKIVREVIEEFPSQAEDYRSGKLKIIGFLIGQVMKRSKGQANPDVVNKILTKIL